MLATDCAFGADGTVWLGAYISGLWTLEVSGISPLAQRYGEPSRIETEAIDGTVFDLAFDDAGSLWVRSQNFHSHQTQIVVSDGNGWRKVDVAAQLEGGEVKAMWVDSAGTKWFASDQKLARFDVQGWHVHNMPQQVIETGQKVETVYVAQDLDSVWVGTTESVWSFDLDATWIEHRLMPSQSVGAEVFYQDPSGRLWVGNELGLFSDSHKGWTYHGYHWTKDWHGRILSMVMDDREQMWVGGWGGIGMLSSDGKRWIHFEEPSKAMLHFVLDVERDRYGTIWFAGYGGVIQFVPTGPRQEIGAALTR